MLQKDSAFSDQQLGFKKSSIQKCPALNKQYSPSAITSVVGFLLLLRYAIGV